MAKTRSCIFIPLLLVLGALLVACSSAGGIADTAAPPEGGPTGSAAGATPVTSSSAVGRVTGVSSTSSTPEVDPMRGDGPPPSAGTRLDQWSVHVANPETNTDYRLFNSARGAVVSYLARTDVPKSLKWDATGPNEWSFIRSPSSNYLAIYNKTAGKYLVANSSSVVGWAYVAKYEWSWSATVDNRIALFNTTRGDYLVSDVHSVPFGQVNWHTRSIPVPVEPEEPVSEIKTASVRMNAQQVVQGYVPFLGSYGGVGNNDTLIEVNNPQAHNVPLFFVKPGYSTSQCAQPAATIPLPPGASLTASQMTTLWGSAAPSLGIKRNFLACAATTHEAVFVNVKYRDN